MSNTKTKRIWTLIWAWGPVVLLMALLFVASAQPKIEPPGGSDDVYFSGMMPVFPGLWDALIKKSSHVVGYGVLAVLGLRAWRLSGVERRAALLAGLVALLYAFTDELHQSTVPGRNAAFYDIGFDLLGIVLFLLAAGWLWPRPTAR